MTETTTLVLSDLNTNGFLLCSIKIKRIRRGQMDSTFVTDIYVRKWIWTDLYCKFECSIIKQAIPE